MSDQNKFPDFESLDSEKNSPVSHDDLLSGQYNHTVDDIPQKFEIPDDNFDAQMWEEEHVSRFPGFLKLIITLALLCVAGLFIYKFVQNSNKGVDSSLEVEKAPVFSDSLSEEELDAENVISDNAAPEQTDGADSAAMQNGDYTADSELVESAEDIPEDTQKAIDVFLAREKVALSNSESAAHVNNPAVSNQNTTNSKNTVDVKETSSAKKVSSAQQLSTTANDASLKVASVSKAKVTTMSKSAVQVQKAPQEKILQVIPSEQPTTQANVQSANVAGALQTMNDSAYAVQLIGMNNGAGFERFVKSLPSNLNVHTYQRVRLGKPWHVAVLAPYANMVEAQSAIERLPTDLKAQKPWVVSLRVIKQQL